MLKPCEKSAYCEVIDRIAADCNRWGTFCVRLRDYLESLLYDNEISPWDYEELDNYAWKYRHHWGYGAI